MSSVNIAILVGRLGKDPELTVTSSGKSVSTISIATTEKYGEKETTQWHRVILWEKMAETAKKYLKKGSRIFIEGTIRYRTYTDKDGQEKYVTEINASKMTMLGDSGGAQNSPKPSEDIPF